MSGLLISVVVPSFNSAQFIEETLCSILDQDYPHIECLVIDGGSTDGTPDILRQYGDKIRWVSEKDRGQSDAINKGLKMARGDIVTYLCADDLYQPGALRLVADYFRQSPGQKWLYGKCEVIDEAGKSIRQPIVRYKTFWQKRYSYRRLLVMDFISQPAAFWRRQMIEEIGLLDVNEHLAMEYDYWLRLGARYEPGYIDEYLASFRLHPVSKSSTSFARAAKDAYRVARRQARSAGAGYLAPFQLLNYLTVVMVYSVLNIVRRKGR